MSEETISQTNDEVKEESQTEDNQQTETSSDGDDNQGNGDNGAATTDNGSADTTKTDNSSDKYNPDKYEVETRGGWDKSQVNYDDINIDQDDKNQINKLIDRRVSPLEAENQALKDQIEVDGYLRDKPELEKYKPIALKYMKHEAYKQIPIKNIFAIVAGNDMMAIGAQRERETQSKVLQTKPFAASGARSNGGSAVDWSKASKSDVEAQIAKAKGMRI